MAKTKKKPEQKVSSKVRSKPLMQTPVEARESGAPTPSELEKVIVSLRKQHFSSNESAVSAVIDAMVLRFGRGDEIELRAFLSDLIETDPQLKALILQGLKA